MNDTVKTTEKTQVEEIDRLLSRFAELKQKIHSYLDDETSTNNNGSSPKTVF